MSLPALCNCESTVDRGILWGMLLAASQASILQNNLGHLSCWAPGTTWQGMAVSVTSKSGTHNGWVKKGTQEGVAVRKVVHSYTQLHHRSVCLTEYFLNLASDQLQWRNSTTCLRQYRLMSVKIDPQCHQNHTQALHAKPAWSCRVAVIQIWARDQEARLQVLSKGLRKVPAPPGSPTLLWVANVRLSAMLHTATPLYMYVYGVSYRHIAPMVPDVVLSCWHCHGVCKIGCKQEGGIKLILTSFQTHRNYCVSPIKGPWVFVPENTK